MTRTRAAIQTFLNHRTADSPFLLGRYTTDLETQVMCDTNGDPGDRPGTYTRDDVTWGNKRWPYQAGSEPNYGDPDIGFSPAEHVQRVGTTWLDYVRKQSVAIGIDIDCDEDHASTTTTNDLTEIEQIVQKLKQLDYVTVIRSTGGNGLHVYVFFDNCPEAQNHHEHTVVARKTLELISKDINYDLKPHVDCVGSVFWIWSNTSPEDHKGFSVVKEGTLLDATRLASITLPTPSVRGDNQADFETTELDDNHKRILEAIQEQGYYFNYRIDMGLVHTHTCAIRDAIKAGLKVSGGFTTNSSGSDPHTANCFLAPQANGVFRVIRFGRGRQEPDWEFKNDKNFCFLNDAKSYQEIVSDSATEIKAGKYILTPEGAAGIAAALGKPLTGQIPEDIWAILTNGTVELHTKEKNLPGWEPSGKTCKIVIEPDTTADLDERLLRRADDVIRYVTEGGKGRGWFHKLSDGGWLEHKSGSELNAVIVRLFGEFKIQATDIMLSNPWSLVNIPFEKEYPGNRQWNFNAPQLAAKPSDSGGDHKHYDMILNHIGGDLDHSVQCSDWCRKGGILTGADYLRTWFACLVHYTDQPLPYLFLAGPQNSGKSIFHELTRFLFTHGVTSANSALTSAFNGELLGCFMVYVEERDLADKRHNSYERIKEWVTGRDLPVHAKYGTPYMAPNYLHFVQMANSSTHLPLEDGDTRIVAIDVPSLGDASVPKLILENHLATEAPSFLRSLLNTVVPPPIDRMRIPALRTGTKTLMERRAMSPLMAFANDELVSCDGHKIEFSKFRDAYKTYCKDRAVTPDADFMMIQETNLRSDVFTLGERSEKSFLLNCTFDSKAKPKKKFKVKNGKF